MNKRLPRLILFTALLVLFLLHNDFWLWHDATLIMGLPAGLLYHIGYCLAAALLFILMVKFAWPSHLEAEIKNSENS